MEKVRIRLDGISKSYYSETAVTQALRKINLTFQKGEFVAITGESGSGKSTLLNIIGGMDTFDEGEMYVDGEPTFQYDEQDWEEYRRSKIGYVFQDYSLIGHYSVLDNMTSALFVMGEDKKEAEKIAGRYLAQVGLDGYEHHRASELSSGQKQRLSIARALAKNTGIIVADEPTGNLDSETGEQIISLLKDLSKDRLVIMVTHNFEQAAAFVTRKIRIHDGELILDVPVNQEEEKSKERKEIKVDESNEQTKLRDKEESKKGFHARHHKTALYFALKNVKSQLGRTVLFTIFLLVIAVASFLLWGELFMHEDDIYTKLYSQKAFYLEDDTRLVIKKADGTEISDEDLQEILKLPYVEEADPCDYANDMNYYIEPEVDYTYLYNWRRPGSGGEEKTLKLLQETNFMRSDYCITEDDLAYGRLPENRNEVVLYAEDDTLLNKSKICYFTAANFWDSNQYYETKVKIVGILKEETTQIYFSQELCDMLSMHVDSGVYRLYYAYDYSMQDYLQKPEWIPIVADDLTGNEMRISKKFEEPVYGEVLFRFFGYDENGNLSEEYTEEMVTILKENHSSTGNFIEVSQEFYDRYYTVKRMQASVYITNYAKTDVVMQQLQKMGYDVISTFRVGTTQYDVNLVYDRLKLMGICAGGLLVLLLAEILILRSLMKIRIKDFYVLKNMGMKMQIIRKISYYEIGFYCVIAVLMTIFAMWMLRKADISFICEMMWYYDWKTYLVFICYNMLLSVFTAAAFNHLLKGRLNA